METVACKFCGQVQSIKVYEGETAEVQAVMACTCTEAKTYQNQRSQLQRAKDQIYDMFGERSSEKYGVQAIDADIIENIKNLLPIIQEERIKNISITVIMKDQIKINIGYSNDKFSIKRSESNSVKREI